MARIKLKTKELNDQEESLRTRYDTQRQTLEQECAALEQTKRKLLEEEDELIWARQSVLHQCTNQKPVKCKKK